MKNEQDALMDKIRMMYPEIGRHGLEAGLTYSEIKKAYIVTFRQGNDELTTQIEKEAAEECLHGSRCTYLGLQVEQFIMNFEDRVLFDRKAA